MTNKTNLHLYEKPDKCLDCGGKLAFNGQSDFNIHVICERCGAWSLTRHIEAPVFKDYLPEASLDTA